MQLLDITEESIIECDRSVAATEMATTCTQTEREIPTQDQLAEIDVKSSEKSNKGSFEQIVVSLLLLVTVVAIFVV